MQEIDKFLIQQERDEQSLMLMDKMTDKRQKTRTEWIQKYEKQMSYQEKNHGLKNQHLILFQLFFQCSLTFCKNYLSRKN